MWPRSLSSGREVLSRALVLYSICTCTDATSSCTGNRTGQCDCTSGNSSNSTARTLSIAGSSTVKPVVDEWQSLIPCAYDYTIAHSGSSEGARRVCLPASDDEAVTIGDMSRQWKSHEAERLDDGMTFECLDSDGARTGRRVTQLEVGIDGLAVVAAQDGPVHQCILSIGGLTLAQLRWIYSSWSDELLVHEQHVQSGIHINLTSVALNNNHNGVKEWSDLGPNPECQQIPIHPYGAGENSGTLEFFGKGIFMGSNETYRMCNLTQVHALESGLPIGAAAAYFEANRSLLGHENCYVASEDDDNIREMVLQDRGGIASFGYAYYSRFKDALEFFRLAEDRVRGILDTDLAKVGPSPFTVVDGSYHFFTRRLYMNVRNDEFELARSFLETAFSERGQEVITDVGYWQINAANLTKMRNRVQAGENIFADYIPVEPDQCANGSELIAVMFLNEFGNAKFNYSCLQCAEGYFKPFNTPTSCDACLAGSYSNLPGQSACVQCARGAYMGETNATSCLQCSPGSFVALKGATTCETCSPGSAAQEEGQTSCNLCEPGYFQPGHGAVTCLPCQPGKYADRFGATACVECTPGYHQPQEAANTTCDRCPVATYTPSWGSSDCTSCMLGLVTAYPGSSSIEHCLCPTSEYLPLFGDITTDWPCRKCPDGMLCPLGSFEGYLPIIADRMACPEDSVCDYPRVEEGLMTRPSEPMKPYRCLREQQCPGGDPGSCSKLKDANQIACGRCVEEPQAYPSGDHCNACDAGFSLVPFFAALVLFLMFIFMSVFALNLDLVKQQTATITISVVAGLTFTAAQSLGVFSSLSLTWFEPMRTFLGIMGIFGFDISALRLTCTLGSDPLKSYIVRQLIAPLAVPLILMSLLIKRTFFKPHIYVLVELTNTVGAIYTIFFISVVISAMDPFICYSHPGSAGESIVSQPSVLCYQDGLWFALMVAGFASIVLVTVPFLGLCAYGTQTYPVMVLSHSPKMLNAFRFLFLRFRSDRYYYGVILLVRNFSIPCILATARGDVAFQVVLLCGTVLVFLVVQLALQPWKTTFLNLYDALLSATLILILLCGTASSDFNASADSIMWLGTGIFTFTFGCGMLTFLKVSLERVRPSRKYHDFICHHKVGAAAQARYLKMQLVLMARHRVFIDSDDLQDLDKLFELVKARVQRLIVYLSSCTLARPWCCGEIVTAHNNNVSMVIVIATDTNLEDIKDRTDWLDEMDFKNSCLLQYGIEGKKIPEAYSYLLNSESIKRYKVRTNVFGRDRIQLIASALLGKLNESTKLHLQAVKDMLVIASDPLDDEATATAGILALRIADKVVLMGVSSVLCLCDLDPQTIDVADLLNVVGSARAIVVILTQGSKESMMELTVIMQAMSSNANSVIPVSTPLYVFPGETYYTEILPVLLGEDLIETDVDMIIHNMRSFFKIIAVLLGTHSSDKVIMAQAEDVVSRVPRIPRTSRDIEHDKSDYLMQPNISARLSSQRSVSASLAVSPRSQDKESDCSTASTMRSRHIGFEDASLESIPAAPKILDTTTSLRDLFEPVDDERLGRWHWAVTV